MGWPTLRLATAGQFNRRGISDAMKRGASGTDGLKMKSLASGQRRLRGAIEAAHILRHRLEVRR